MNIKKLILTSAIALGSLCGYAQQANEVTQYVFNPHWYGQLQVGGQETLGEGDFGKLLSPNAQIALGYQFNPLFGARLGINSWQSKGIMNFQNVEGNWKYKYVAPAVDFTFDLTNAIGGYNPTRVYDINLFAGIGANVAFKNDEANDYNNQFKSTYLGEGGNVLQNIWDGTKTRLLGRFGVACDFSLTQNLKLGVELAANVLNDNYNSKKADNADWYFNGLVGVKYTFGPTYSKKVIQIEEPAPVEIIKIQKEIVTVHDTIVVEKVVEPVKPQEKYVGPTVSDDALQRNVFFTINSAKISKKEMVKVKEIADYMKAHKDTKVHIIGYADAGTGTLAINTRLARQRAQAVVTALTKIYGISAKRITQSHMTNHEEQPFPDDPIKNRVSICTVEE